VRSLSHPSDDTMPFLIGDSTVLVLAAVTAALRVATA
jgi:hypothetical protein